MVLRKLAGSAGLFVFGLIFAGVGYAFAFHWGIPLLEKARASETWPVTSGVVETATVVSSTDGDGDTMYEADIVYRYAVLGRDYRGSDVEVGGQVRSSSRKHALRVVNRYQPGDAVDVHYNPDDPADAILEPGATPGGHLVYWIGLAFLAFGALIASATLVKLAWLGLVIGAAATARS